VLLASARVRRTGTGAHAWQPAPPSQRAARVGRVWP